MAEPVTPAEVRSVLRELELRQPVLEGVQALLEVAMLDMQRLRDEVAQTRGVNESAVTLLRNIAGQLRDAAAGEAAANVDLNALADELDSSTNDLAAAVAENDPNAGGGGTTDTGGTPDGGGLTTSDGQPV